MKKLSAAAIKYVLDTHNVYIDADTHQINRDSADAEMGWDYNQSIIDEIEDKMGNAAYDDDDTLLYKCSLINDGFVVENFFREGTSAQDVLKSLEMLHWPEGNWEISLANTV